MRILLLFVGLFLFVAPLKPAQEIEVPTEVQLVFFQKILAFDRNLKERAGAELVVGVLYQSSFRNSLNFKDEFMAAGKKTAVDPLLDLPIRYVAIELTNGINLGEQAAKHNVDIFYVAPLRAVEMKTVTAVSRARKILTFTGVPAYVEIGISVGIGIKGDNPRIIVNLPAAKAEGAEFNAQLLKLAKIVE